MSQDLAKPIDATRARADIYVLLRLCGKLATCNPSQSRRRNTPPHTVPPIPKHVLCEAISTTPIVTHKTPHMNTTSPITEHDP